MSIAKEEARKLIDLFPDHATWDDIMYEFYVKKKLARALDEVASAKSCRTRPRKNKSVRTDEE